MYKLIIIVLLALNVNAAGLSFVKGQIKAHTKVFGESHIDPMTKQIDSKLTMDGNISSMKGKISISTLSLKSDNDKRDEHMYKTLNAQSNPYITFDIKNIVKTDKMYQINGVLILNGVTKNVSSSAEIVDANNTLNLSGSFSIKLTDYNIEPPKLLFLTVRDQIDISYDLTYKIK